MVSKLEPYELSADKLDLLQQCFSHSDPDPDSLTFVHNKRPKPSQLRDKILTGALAMMGLSTFQPREVMEAVLRSVNRAWEDYYEGSVSSNEFMRTPFGASYEVVTMPGKGRGIIASRDIKAGETVLQDTPVLVLPHHNTSLLIFLTLPRKALEAILLLHNEKPHLKQTTQMMGDTPIHRLMDLLQGITDTNCFETLNASCGKLGVLLLTGSLFNHSETSNLTRAWNDKIEKMEFISTRDIKKGDELEVDYMPDEVGAARAERLKGYGIGK